MSPVIGTNKAKEKEQFTIKTVEVEKKLNSRLLSTLWPASPSSTGSPSATGSAAEMEEVCKKFVRSS